MADRYCTECGMALGPDDKFCPGCGAEMKDVEDYSAPAAQPARGYYPNQGSGEMAGRLRVLGVLTLVWGIFALLVAISTLTSVEATIDAMVKAFMENPSPVEGYSNMWDYMVANGVNADTFRMLLWAIGGTFAVSGACGTISGILMLKRTNYTLAMVTLLISTLTAIIGIITLIIGIIIFVMFTKTKEEFTS